MAMTAVDIINTIYPQSEDPGGTFDAWLSPCGGSALVPEELKTAFDVLSQATDMLGRGSRTPKNVKDKHGGKGKKGDEGNPRGGKRPAGGQSGNSNKKNKKCHVAAKDAVKKVGHHTRRSAECKNDVEVRH